MSYQHLSKIKHRITLTGQEIALLRDKIAVISPMEYDLSDFAALRKLYGQFDHTTFQSEPDHFKYKGG